MEIVTAKEIARRLGVKHRTVYQWRYRGLLPEPDVMSEPPLWEWDTVQKWAKDTNRLKGSRRSGQG